MPVKPYVGPVHGADATGEERRLSEEELDYLESKIPELAQAAVTAAYWQALAAGHSVLEADGGAIYEVFPNGVRKFYKQIEPPTPVKRGQRITLP